MIRFFRKKREDAPAISELHDTHDLEAAVAASHIRPVLLYKHSSICGASLWARRVILQLTETTDPPVFELVVQRARALSDQIAERWDIRHETPQALLVSEGRIVWNASHGAIRATAIRSALEAA